jgi:hypothetical protein
MRAAIAAYRAADAALRAHEAEHGCRYPDKCEERTPLASTWCEAQFRLEQAALVDEAPLTHTVTTTYVLEPWEPHEERTSVRWWRAAGMTEAARIHFGDGTDEPEVWHWHASLPFGERKRGSCATEPAARDAADAALADLCARSPRAASEPPDGCAT